MHHKPIHADRLPALLRAMPKAELHMHIEGSLEPELMFALAKRNNVPLRFADEQALRDAYVFNNLQEFLDIYHAGTLVLKTEQDFYDMAGAYLTRAQADNVLNTEIFFDTQTHTGHGLDAATVVNGLHRACTDAPAKFGMTASLILCFLRHLSEDEAFECLEQVLPLRDKIVGIGLASSEVGHPPEKFAKVFARARELGFRLVAHAGEEAPPAYIWSALDVLKVERIDHGVQAIHDATLMQRLVQDRVPLTMCPLSNLKLCVFPTLAEHTIRRMLDAGIMATVNSDDPAYFGGYINENFTQTFAALGMTSQHAYQLARNSFDASFIDASTRSRYVERLDGVFETFL
ncbi:adenosine deaminase [Candidatus Aalborgicola defluviihabitans]|jgi:adenosine deaminase|uniref:adenosine deaminase n=1 Tax=Candidatus Aalborgicola defluviihabitans TaxID=3386187 RepID=UPI001DCC2F67|nr:adenosine deaminase [Burkholderiales bacterium]MBK7280943.1 adenosine deaminase [Burkholderiales bacterium]MBL0243210.1 adenosine deaminase [Rhodoferax sp.]